MAIGRAVAYYVRADHIFSAGLNVGTVSCMRKLWHENFMHENFIFMQENEISMHKNENFAQRFSRVKIPWMKLCTARLPMNISWAKTSCQGRNLNFHVLHGNIIFMHEIFISQFFSCMYDLYGRICFPQTTG